MRARAGLVVLALLAGCGDGGPRPIAFEAYGVEAQAAFCAWAVRCRHVPDDANCRRLLDPKRYDTRRAADGIRLGRLRYDPEAAARCLAAGRAAECPTPAFADPSCALVFTGLVPLDGVCTTAFDCAGGGRCLDARCEAGCCNGTCFAPEPVSPPTLADPGEPCVTHTDCVDTAYCDIDLRCHALPRRAGQHCLYGCYFGDLFCEANSETCFEYASLGEDCGDAALCSASYAFCDGVCRPRPGAGDACDDTSRRCVGGTRCVSGICTQRGVAGDPCAADDECDIACDPGQGRCVTYMPCISQLL